MLQHKTLYNFLRVCDETGALEISPVGKAPLDHGFLDSDDAFILDMGSSGVYAWIGKGATQQERSQAFSHAQKFINDKGYPTWTPLCRVVEGAEDNLFQSCFSNWPRPKVDRQVSKSAVIPEKIKDPQVDLSGLFKKQREEEKKDDDIKDDGSGKLKVGSCFYLLTRVQVSCSRIWLLLMNFRKLKDCSTLPLL